MALLKAYPQDADSYYNKGIEKERLIYLLIESYNLVE